SGARGPELVRHVARLRGAPETADAVIERLGVAALGRTTVRRLSGGERRRVSLACALVGHPDLVVLDEPTAGLDPRGRVIVWETIRALRDSGTTVLLSTHLLDEAESLSDRIAIVAHGRCVAQGTLAQLTSAGSDVLSFEAPVHLDTLSLATALPEGCDAEEVSPGRYRVRGPIDPHVLATVTSWCAQHGVMPRNLRTGGTSLEDLFWDLTAGAEETS
ncbi:MAG: ATP-binding cassette domain-containing protein, partial [Candidatus Nanopelagicales bacterium]